MRSTFEEFELRVQSLSSPKDFKKNKDKLKHIRMCNYDSFICILKLGGQISNSIIVCEEIFKLSIETQLTDLELIHLSNKFRFLNAFIDERDDNLNQ